jgi:hypothetical protein
MTRSRLAAAAMVLGALAVLIYTLARPSPRQAAAPGDGTSNGAAAAKETLAALAAVPHVLFRHTGRDNTYSRMAIVALADTEGARQVTSLACERIAFAGGHGICLQAHRDMLTTYEAVLFDSTFAATATLKLDGPPTRTRVAPNGRLGAITTFVVGRDQGYTSLGFSTRTILVDLTNGQTIANLEQFKAERDRHPFTAPDFNFWGVTFAHDSNTFYATVMTNRQTYLVRGDVSRQTLTVLRADVECPALSPDNTRIAFKKRVGTTQAPWRFFVLDLRTMQDTPVGGESRSIDDQIEWLDDGHVLYGASRDAPSSGSDVWVAPAAGSDAPRVFLKDAESPAIVR